jgi:chromosome segregation protein
LLHFTKLRLHGFKSFVDPTELVIETGLTGIVGPNGCGKSNLVEALRWVMGETSPKSMRGGGMDDVIFAGTSSRPARNVAEVVLALDNQARRAPAQFNEFEDLEVSRRIERGAGSLYRVNGKEVRARDVQTLFADASTGAHSAAIVSQGRVGAVINAKATDRRHLIEEAAGITGLHSRRHEAELRLRAAEANLERLDDVIATLESQLQGLKKQARQANRYRKLSDRIRRLEALALHQEWRQVVAEIEAAQERLTAAERAVADLTGRSAAAAAEQAEAAAALPALRQAETEAAAALQRLVLGREALAQEEARVAGERARAEQRLAQCRSDLERERRSLNDALESVQRLDDEAASLTAAADDAEARAAAKAALAEAEAAVAQAEAALTALTESIAEGEARATALARRATDLAQRRERLRNQAEAVAAEQASLAAQGIDPAAHEAAERAVADSEAAVERARALAEEREQTAAAARDAEAAARDRLQAAGSELGKLEAEAKALAGMLSHEEEEAGAPIIDSLDVTPGFEAALAAALGDDLSASANVSAPVHWCVLPPYGERQPLPTPAQPMSDVTRGPDALTRRLSQVGVVADARVASRLQPELTPGQRLVTCNGGLWRWDGYTVAPGTPTAAEARLRQHNRLAEIRAHRPELESEATAAEERYRQAQEAAAAAVAAERQARADLHQTFQAAGAARDARAKLVQQAAAADSRMSALEETATRLAEDLTEAEAGIAETARDRESLPDLAGARAEADRQRATLAERRIQADRRRSDLDRLLREAEARRARLAQIDDERQSWTARADAAKAQCAEMQSREEAAAGEIEALAGRPAEIEARRAVLRDEIERAETARRGHADRLAEAESRLTRADKALKEAEAGLAAAREERVRVEAQGALHEQHMDGVRARAQERLGCEPSEALAAAGMEPDTGDDLEAVDAKLQKLVRERDAMGPVNLRAEREADELDQRIVELQSERADLTAAIGRLRHGIGSLNREGRERLLTAFEAVNRHFTELFVRLFGGGRAHLQLTEAEDPLDAGLEIFASPPGKRLQVLSLLSGGEQALTATALLFAVFLTNPAPICVMDEVDAPLDDANVERFCALLADLAAQTRTRFLVITHNSITMARMDRLFGVTMADRGISQLVSVDLATSEHMAAAE